MHSKLQVLLASRSKAALADLEAKLTAAGAHALRTRLIENGHADPLWGLDYVPDIVVIALNERGHHDLASLIEERSGGGATPPMIVVAEHGDAQTMRLAMQVGACDFLSGAVTAEDLMASIEQASSRLPKDHAAPARPITAVVNAKGGSGATFVACNLAHLLTAVSERSTALVSLDLQFESLAEHFDVKVKHSLLQVLGNVGDLDAVALDAYMTQHDSGLRLLAAKPDNVFGDHVDQSTELGTLLDKLAAHYEHVVIDMPRRVDGYTIQVLEHASQVVLVVQQTLSHLRDANRMLQIFEHHGVRRERVLVVVNRFEKSSSIGIDDVKRALRTEAVVAIPSDFKTVAESINLGLPIYEHARGSAVTKALMALETRLGGGSAKRSSGLLGKALSSLLRKEA
jgi:pilus assembly protein CpaE